MKFNYDDYMKVDEMVKKSMDENNLEKMTYFMDIRSDIYRQLDHVETEKVNVYIDKQFEEKVGA